MKTLRSLALILLPLLLGALSSYLAQVFWKPIPVLVFKVDAAMTIFVVGVFVTLLLAAVTVGDWRKRKETSREIDKVKKVEDESRRRFIHRLDHEIKNPLTGLQAALVNLQEAPGPEERRQAGLNAHRAVERLRRLLADLRKLSDLEERQLECLPVDIPGLLDEMVEAARSLPEHGNRQINLMVSRVPWPLPTVTGDRDLLGLAFYNLVDNALKFTSGKDTVEVRAREDGKVIIIEVADSGPGIPADESARIFEELYRGANARGVEGSGLGLALVRRIVGLHGGEIQVRSKQAGGGGTVFTVRIPMTKQ